MENKLQDNFKGENFFLEDKFYSDFDNLMDDLFYDEQDQRIKNLSDDWKIKVECASLENVLTITSERIIDECIYEDRLSEYCDELEKIKDVLEKEIDFERVNALLPKLWYPNNKFVEITKHDLLEYIK